MLKFLNISNLAVIEQLDLEFQPGLNVLSGETGSGKSIIIDALGLLLGNRATPDFIRTGEARAFVEGVFTIDDNGVNGANGPLRAALEEAGIEVADDEMVIKRELSSSGKGRVFIDHQTASVALLKAIQPYLVDIHGQGDQQSLLSQSAQLDLLDAFAEARSSRERVEEAFDRLSTTARLLDESQRNEAERLQLLDITRFQSSEIESARLSAEEEASIGIEHRRLVNAERLSTLCSEAYQLIYEDEDSAAARIASAARKISELASLDETLASRIDQVEQARYLLEDTAFMLRTYASEIERSPSRLIEVEERMTEIDRLKRKYGPSLESVMATGRTLKAKLEELEEGEGRTESLERELMAAFDEYWKRAASLSEKRNRAIRQMERAIESELSELALAHARFSLRLSAPQRTPASDPILRRIDHGRSLGRTGTETVEFYFSANPGEDARPLSAVASGGELSRTMLALKTITGPATFPRTLIFDEIDAGIGGRVSDAVGSRLQRLARSNQVLCVTHQAQIARYASAHFRVTKEIVGKRTHTHIVELDQDGRVEELARMIDGAEVTATARKHARELLRAGR
jgi:DNA repair protein RecN (Recombination protein N)